MFSLRRVLQVTTIATSLFLQTVADTEEAPECGMYLAISSTSTVDETRWGIYAGKNIDNGSPLGGQDVAINIFNLQGNTQMADDSAESDMVAHTVDFFEQFIWVPIPSGGQFELEEGRTVTAIPGAGVLGGFNPKLTNADWNHSAAFFRPSLGEEPGVSHPGRGAYTNFYNVELRSKTEIPAGREIFLEYGDNWEEEAKDEDLTAEDYKKLDATVEKMAKFFAKYKDELDEKARTDIYDFLIRDVMGAAAGAAKGKKIVDLLPAYPESLDKVSESGGALAYSQPKSSRSIDWLQTHGRCIDNIIAGASTVPHAGRGAFATRKIKEGGLVAPVPLVHLPTGSIMDMHEIGQSEEENEEEGPVYFKLSDEVQGKQLLYNYCYGHPESNMLFFPSGSVSSLINHSKKPNAKMSWSSHPAHQRHWYDMKPEELLSQETLYIGLLMEIVALREIEEGEEIFIDYGDDWSAAWDAHVKEWENRKASGDVPEQWPIRALDLNDEYTKKAYKKPDELEKEPYPSNVMLKCFVQLSSETIPDKIDGKPVREWVMPAEGVFDSDLLEDCTVKDYREVDDGALGSLAVNYTIALARDNEGSRITNVPHRAFVFVDKPATGDQFIQNPFRHYISIPDDVFPQGPWRDLKQQVA